MSHALFTPKKLEEHCPKCGHLLQIKQGKTGKFLACSAYPACTFIKSLHGQGSLQVMKDLPQNCPECEGILQLKRGQFGIFIGCSNYPQCHYIVQEKVAKNEKKYPCPACKKGHLIPCRNRSGKIFYGCDQYPKCKMTLAQEPVEKTCPLCHGKLALLKKDSAEKQLFCCINKHCQHEFSLKKETQ